MTPADARHNTSQTMVWCSTATAVMIIDFEIKPENNGNAEIEREPIMQKIVVHGMLL